MIISETHHFINALPPVADAFSGTVYSDVISMRNYNSLVFVVQLGVGTTGTSTFTVQACDDTIPSNRTPIEFKYRQSTTIDAPGTLTQATTAGFTSTAGSNKVILIEVDAADLASTGYEFVQLKAVESVDDPVLGGILAVLAEPRYGQAVQATAIA